MILNWHDTYKERLTDARTALSRIRRGARIFIGSNTRAAIKEGRADYTPIGHLLKTHLESGVYELEIPFSGEEKEEV